VFNELKTLGCQDILTEVVDSLNELAEAIGTIYPKTAWQPPELHRASDP
jgi:transposase-like protein